MRKWKVGIVSMAILVLLVAGRLVSAAAPTPTPSQPGPG